ncbi:hypothetical protein PIB30_054343, partial [Stylosanthes scabra]|nr:hypothetical protein [Stylosanthes scabra]
SLSKYQTNKGENPKENPSRRFVLAFSPPPSTIVPTTLASDASSSQTASCHLPFSLSSPARVRLKECRLLRLKAIARRCLHFRPCSSAACLFILLSSLSNSARVIFWALLL